MQLFFLLYPSILRYQQQLQFDSYYGASHLGAYTGPSGANSNARSGQGAKLISPRQPNGYDAASVYARYPGMMHSQGFVDSQGFLNTMAMGYQQPWYAQQQQTRLPPSQHRHQHYAQQQRHHQHSRHHHQFNKPAQPRAAAAASSPLSSSTDMAALPTADESLQQSAASGKVQQPKTIA